MSQPENTQSLSMSEQLSQALGKFDMSNDLDLTNTEIETDIDLSDESDLLEPETENEHEPTNETEFADESDIESESESESGTELVNQDPDLTAQDNAESVSLTQPFAGLIKQRLTVLLGVGHSPDIAGYNYSNPFSKRLGVIREFLTEVAPRLEQLAGSNLLLVTDDIEFCSEYIEDFYRRLSVPQKYQSLFDSMLDFYYEQNMEKSNLLLQTYISGLNWATLPTDKGEAALNNALTFLSKLARANPHIELELQIGVNTDQLIDPYLHKAYALLMSFVEREELTAIQISSNSPESNFDIVFRKTWN